MYRDAHPSTGWYVALGLSGQLSEGKQCGIQTGSLFQQELDKEKPNSLLKTSAFTQSIALLNYKWIHLKKNRNSIMLTCQNYS